MQEIKLYHGSENIVQKPLFHFGNPKNDYGYGFYCTENIELAKEWASTEEKDGFVNEYVINLKGLSILNLSNKDFNILNWLAILLENRTFELSSDIAVEAKSYIKQNFLVEYKDYDIIKGYRADDSYFAFANAFLNNTISIRKLNKAMYLGKLGEQIVITSEKAFSKLSFISSCSVDHNIYYPKKINRDSLARQDFFKMKSGSAVLESDSLFIADIIRGGIKNGDPRIPDVLFD